MEHTLHYYFPFSVFFFLFLLKFPWPTNLICILLLCCLCCVVLCCVEIKIFLYVNNINTQYYCISSGTSWACSHGTLYSNAHWSNSVRTSAHKKDNNTNEKNLLIIFMHIHGMPSIQHNRYHIYWLNVRVLVVVTRKGHIMLIFFFTISGIV